MIWKAELGHAGETVPAGSILLCSNCLHPRYLTVHNIYYDGRSIVGIWTAKLVDGRAFPSTEKALHCVECHLNIFDDKSHHNWVRNEPLPPSMYIATYLEPKTFWGLLIGYMILASELDPCDNLWGAWGAGVTVSTSLL